MIRQEENQSKKTKQDIEIVICLSPPHSISQPSVSLHVLVMSNSYPQLFRLMKEINPFSLSQNPLFCRWKRTYSS